MSIDITVTRDPPLPKRRCSLCGLTIYPEYTFGMMDLELFNNINKVKSIHEGILICENCHEKLILECGMSTT
jgi:hypothetical protein